MPGKPRAALGQHAVVLTVVGPMVLVDGCEGKTLCREGEGAEIRSGHRHRACLGITS